MIIFNSKNNSYNNNNSNNSLSVSQSKTLHPAPAIKTATRSEDFKKLSQIKKIHKNRGHRISVDIIVNF